MSFFGSKPYIVGVVTLGIFTDSFAYAVCISMFPFVVQKFGDDKDVGILISCFSIGLLLGSIVFGILGDVLNKRRTMAGGLVILAASTILMALVEEYWSLAIGRFVQGFSSGSIWVVGLALIVDSHNKEELGFAMSIPFTGYTLGTLVGPLAGGYLYKYGYSVPFYSTLGLICIDLIGRLLLKDPPAQVQTENITFIDFIKGLPKNKPLVIILTCTLLVGTVIGSLEVSMSLYLRDRYGFSSDQIGLGFLAIVIPETLTSPIGGWMYDKYGFGKTAVVGLIGSAGLLIALGFNFTYWVFVIILVFMTSCYSLALSPLLPEISTCVSPAAYSKTYGLFNCVFGGGFLVGPFVGSLLYQYFGWLWQCVMLSALTLLQIMLVYYYIVLARNSKVIEPEVPLQV
ncbi:hypothetical protein HK103_003838 [Boothiomyces macroporosus]|uniref:Major facilitator superfamily (MFS) profile domain-containing protein n=1 Tax=Boothiomyces macroporosus TaxID=261099 RepID=A0AAD5UP86_9FUNG|nr:hypothetical protein HK103_003838 [Boothiomyces macroporosus]